MKDFVNNKELGNSNENNDTLKSVKSLINKIMEVIINYF